MSLFKKLFLREKWNIGIIEKPITHFLTSKKNERIKWFPERARGHFAADPFGFYRDNQLHIYYEDFNSWKGEGQIRRLIADHGGNIVSEATVLSTDKHCSYPYLIEYNGDFFAVPEMSQSEKVVLYKIDPQTGALKEVTTLLENVKLSDPTIFQYDKRWWLFGVINELELYAWHAPDLFGPWESHTNNPIKRNTQSSRPAGTPFVHENVLYRPSQDCSKTYGGRIAVNRIKTLTSSQFDEDTVRVIEPEINGKYDSGIHTISAVGSITLVDGKRMEFSPQVVFSKILKKIFQRQSRQNRKLTIGKYFKEILVCGFTPARIMMHKALAERNARIISPCVDLGGGNAQSQTYLNDFINDHGDKVLLADISPEADVYCDLEKTLPFENKQFKTALLINVLPVIFDFELVSKEVYRILEKGGKAYIWTSFNANTHPHPNDYFRFTEQSLKKIFEQAGFSRVEVQSYGGLGLTIGMYIGQLVWKIPLISSVIHMIFFGLNNLINMIDSEKNAKKWPMGHLAIATK